MFVRLEYQGDTKMFSSILELNNLSVMYSQKCGLFFFTWVRSTWFETCAPVLCSCCTRVIVFDLIGYYIIYLAFSSWWVTPFRDTEIISTEKRCFHKWFRSRWTWLIQKAGRSLCLRSDFGKFTAVAFGEVGNSILVFPEMMVFTLSL